MNNYSHAQVEDWAKGLWLELNESPSFPCDIERLAIITCPIVIECVNGLRLSHINAHFENKLFYQSDCDDKLLHGFLVALSGQGILFINGCDKLDERRFTIAHELAHFLIEHLFPRKRAAELWGEEILDTLDGAKPITIENCIKIIIGSDDLIFNKSLLEKHNSNALDRMNVWRAETVADRLASEILAPYHKVRETIITSGIRNYTAENCRMLTSILTSLYGLPLSIAPDYAMWLLDKLYGGPSLFEEWGISE